MLEIYAMTTFPISCAHFSPPRRQWQRAVVVGRLLTSRRNHTGGSHGSSCLTLRSSLANPGGIIVLAVSIGLDRPDANIAFWQHLGFLGYAGFIG